MRESVRVAIHYLAERHIDICVDIAGFDFGCGADVGSVPYPSKRLLIAYIFLQGTCNVSGAWPPMTSSYGADGIGQMQHFVNVIYMKSSHEPLLLI